MASATSIGSRRPEAVVERWISAFNERDLSAMLACLDDEVEFHPLKLHGIAATYAGHLGVRRWFAQVTELGHDHQIVDFQILSRSPATIVATGGLTFGGEPVDTPFCAVHRVRRGRIVSAHHYMSDPGTLDRLGLVDED
jgi:ketosteroid isomerase-like protein